MTGQEYSPSTSLCLLHEHKRAYQPNMLKAISLTLLIAATAAIYIASFVPDMGPQGYLEHQGFAGFHGYRVTERDVVSWKGPVGNSDFFAYDPDLDFSLFAGYPSDDNSPGMYGTGNEWGEASQGHRA